MLLLKRLAANGLKRQENQTLRDFAGEVDEKLNTVNMLKLTEKYERVLYRNAGSIKEWKESIELWENLIKNEFLTIVSRIDRIFSNLL